MHTEIVYPNAPYVVDDGCDYTALIIWRMNANARASTRSAFVPEPVPVQVMQPKFSRKAAASKPAAKKKAKKVDFPAKNLVAVMLGKTLSYDAILAKLDRCHPGHGVTIRNLQTRINTMLKSSHCQITRHELPVPEFTLVHVDVQFYTNSEKSLEAM
ncbi:hypothetical protein [Serratia sp. D1N4]